MNIGVCIRMTPDADMQKSFRQAAEEGFSSCQLISWYPELCTPQMTATLRELVKETGVEISGFWCGWSGPEVWDFYEGQNTLGLVPPEYRATRVAELKAGADYALELGVTDIITHMGFIPEYTDDPRYAGFIDAVRDVAEHLKAQGQNLLFETGQETPVTLLRVFETVGTGNLFVNLDTANLILYGKANPVDSLDVFGKYVRNIHAKDGMYPTNGRELGVEVKLGAGRVDFPRLIARLRELGYDGPLTIEREITGEQQLLDIREARDFLKRLIAE